MGEVTSETLQAWLTEHGGVPDLAKLIRAAAEAEGHPLTIKPGDLHRNIYRWLRGACGISPDYQRWIRKAVTADASPPGDDLAGLADRLRLRAAALPTPRELTALETAALARLPQDDAVHALEAVAEAKAGLRQFLAGMDLLEGKLAAVTHLEQDDDRTG